MYLALVWFFVLQAFLGGSVTSAPLEAIAPEAAGGVTRAEWSAEAIPVIASEMFSLPWARRDSGGSDQWSLHHLGALPHSPWSIVCICCKPPTVWALNYVCAPCSSQSLSLFTTHTALFMFSNECAKESTKHKVIFYSPRQCFNIKYTSLWVCMCLCICHMLRGQRTTLAITSQAPCV